MNHLADFETLSLTDLQDFVERGQEENLHLDFKLLKDASLSSGDDKRNLACALSGFANSSGGLIVWGVDARKNSEGVDCAVELRPIPQVALLIGRLNALTGDGVDPSVAGVRHRAIETVDGQGFAITLVPESDTGPHMAKLAENRYYKRIGDGFYKMEHYDIADMFGQRKKPKLLVFYRVTGKHSQAQVHLGLRNDGRATARAPFFAFESPPRQNSCRPDMILNLGAIRKKDGTVRRSIQEQSGGTVAAAGERRSGRGGERNWSDGADIGTLA